MMIPVPLTWTSAFEIFGDFALVAIGLHFGRWICSKTFERI